MMDGEMVWVLRWWMRKWGVEVLDGWMNGIFKWWKESLLWCGMVDGLMVGVLRWWM